MHAIISIKPRHVLDLLRGTKKVELRRRRVGLKPGAKLWIYTTLPAGRVEALAEVDEVIHCTPLEAWRSFKNMLGLSKAEFDAYAKSCAELSVIVLKWIVKLEPKLSLSAIRRRARGFQPPQYFSYLRTEGALFRALSGAYPRALLHSLDPA
jgi:predicted transcriptional regulator